MGKLKNEVGNRYGRLRVLSRAGTDKFGQATWLCQCDCGSAPFSVLGGSLRSKTTQSCGCKNRERIAEIGRSALINKVGDRHGRLLVLKRAENDAAGHVQWLCKCDCGELTIVRSGSLGIENGTKSCGCLQAEISAKFMSKLVAPNKLPFGIGSMRRLMLQYQHSAKRRGYVWGLTEEQFVKLTSDLCSYCGTKPAYIKDGDRNNGAYVYNGIDRRNNELGYSFENCVTACGVCNKMKGTKTYNEFIEKITQIYHHRVEEK